MVHNSPLAASAVASELVREVRSRQALGTGHTDSGTLSAVTSCVPFRQQAIQCVDCRRTMRGRGSAIAAALGCGRCNSTWMGNASFFNLMADAQPTKNVTELMIHNDGTPRRPCPVCRRDMEIAWIDFLQLDQCEEHGIWFDDGELACALMYDVGHPIAEYLRKRVHR